MRSHEARDISIKERIKSILPDKKPPISVTPEYKPDGSFVLQAEVEGKKVTYNSHTPYTLESKPGLLAIKFWKIKPDDILEREGIANSLTITNEKGVKTTMLNDDAHEMFSAVVINLDGTVRGTLSRYGQLQPYRITEEAGKTLLNNMKKRQRDALSGIVYNTHMAKRVTGVGSKKTGHPHKTKKRLEAKRVMLELKASKRKKK